MFATLSDIFGQALLAVQLFVMASAAIVGAFISSFVGRNTSRLFRRDFKTGSVVRTRVAGGAVGALLSYLLIGGPGWGPGFGPGEGGFPGRGQGIGDFSATNSPTAPSVAKRDTSPVEGSGSANLEPRRLRIVLLGARTKPPIEQPDRIFAFADEGDSKSAVNADAVAERAQKMKEKGELREVELVLYPDPESPGHSLSTTLENAEELIGKLCKKVNDDAQVPFIQPDPRNPKQPIIHPPTQRSSP